MACDLYYLHYYLFLSPLFRNQKINTMHGSLSLRHLVPDIAVCLSVFICVCADNFDIEHLSNSLFHEWNHFQNNAITDDTKASHSIHASQQRNRIELEQIFVRVGLQMTVACKLADEVYGRLSLSADQRISFDDFLSLLQCNSERQHEQHLQRPWQSQTLIRQSCSDDDEYTTSPSNDNMIIDLHASHSGLCI